MSHGIDASVEVLKSPCGDPQVDTVLAQPKRPQLPPGHHTELVPGKGGERRIHSTRLRFAAA